MLSNIVGLLLVSNMIASIQADGVRAVYSAAESNKGLDQGDHVIDQMTLSSLSHPEWAKGKSYDENLDICLDKCSENVECRGVQLAPRNWDHQECFLMKGGDTYSRYGWAAKIKDIKAVSMGAVESNKGLDQGDHVIDQMTLSSLSHPEWANGKSYDENLDLCVKKCYKSAECKGIQIAPKHWDHQECFLMKGGDTYSRDGWATSVVSEKDVDIGKPKSNQGLDSSDQVIDQITLSSLSHPEWAKGRSYDENLELCDLMCLNNAECKGVQIAPRDWDHQECFLMKGDQSYSRPGWAARLKEIH